MAYQDFIHPIPAIKQCHEDDFLPFIKKFLKLDFNFHHRYLRTPFPCRRSYTVTVLSRLHLVAECPFSLHQAPCQGHLLRFGCIAPDSILNSLAESAALMSFVNRSVLIITSELPCNQQAGWTCCRDSIHWSNPSSYLVFYIFLCPSRILINTRRVF